MCGLCLPHCPTYQQTRVEAESPRGRIALMNALWQGKLPQDDKLTGHLNSCLTCRACESVCPSGVNYGYLIDQTRQRLAQNQPAPDALTQFAINKLAPRRTWLRVAGVFLWLYQVLGIRKLAQWLGFFRLSTRLQRLDDYLPSPQTPATWQRYYPAKGAHKKDVALFTGCASETLDPNTLRAGIKVLTHCGYGVHIPKEQRCCGALHQHRGDHVQARTLIQANADTFNQAEVQEVIAVATGCTSMLSEYPSHLGEQPAWRARDISDFLVKENALSAITWRPLKQKIAIHTPCSMNNVLKLKQTSHKLLAHIPGIELHALRTNNVCCGAAGSYMLDHPQMADALLDNKLRDINDIAPDIVVSSNIGCALHLSAGLRKKNPALRVIHPIELLAQQLPNP